MTKKHVERAVQRRVAVNGLFDGMHWRGTWIAFTPDVYGELFSRLAHPTAPTDRRSLTDEWLAAEGLYKDMELVKDQHSSQRLDWFLGFATQPRAAYSKLHAAVKNGRPREMLTKDELHIVKTFLEAVVAYIRVSQAIHDQKTRLVGHSSRGWTAIVSVADVARVLAKPEDKIKNILSEQFVEDIRVSQQTIQRLEARVKQHKLIWPGKDHADEHRLNEEWAALNTSVRARDNLQSRGLMPAGYMTFL